MEKELKEHIKAELDEVISMIKTTEDRVLDLKDKLWLKHGIGIKQLDYISGAIVLAGCDVTDSVLKIIKDMDEEES